MFTDILTITRKDIKEIFVQRGSLRGGLLNVLIIVAVIGILFPIQYGGQWLSNPIGLVSVAFFPLLMSMGVVADAFAGERERHTLETLLASRLSDASILFGKILAAVTYGFGIALAGMILGAVTINVSGAGTGFYRPALFAGALLSNLLGAILISSLGALASLHASSVRQAYQRLSIGFIIIWLPIILAPQLLPPAWLAAIDAWAERVNGLAVAAVAFGVLLAIDTALVLIAMGRFRRSQLVLD